MTTNTDNIETSEVIDWFGQYEDPDDLATGAAEDAVHGVRLQFNESGRLSDIYDTADEAVEALAGIRCGNTLEVYARQVHHHVIWCRDGGRILDLERDLTERMGRPERVTWDQVGEHYVNLYLEDERVEREILAEGEERAKNNGTLIAFIVGDEAEVLAALDFLVTGG